MDTGTRDADNIPVILCVNFCDEALRTGLVIDYNLLEDVLQIPVIPCCARRRSHLDDIKAAIHYAAKPGNRKAFCYDCLDFSPKKLAAECICASSDTDGARRVLLDLLLTGPVTGKIILLFLLAGVLHLTMIAAGFPSRLLWEALSRLELSLDRAMTPGLPAALSTGDSARFPGQLQSCCLPLLCSFFSSPCWRTLDSFPGHPWAWIPYLGNAAPAADNV